jgi:hypothetical protein
MEYPVEQIEELKRYCSAVRGLGEGNAVYLYLEALRLPAGCEPSECNALLRPFAGADGYPSQLYFSVQIRAPYGKNWNVLNARICEKNWFAFSWKASAAPRSPLEALLNHLAALTQPR